MSVQTILASFATGPVKGAFRHITRDEVLNGIKDRLANPKLINQGLASLCGPASFLYCILQDSPEAYVTYVTQLWLKGNGRIRSLEVRPSADCLNAKPNGIDPVDWVALASLRDSENTFFDYQDSSNAVGGITMPGTMASWFEKAGYRQVTNQTNVYFTKDAASMQTALGLIAQGRRVCMFINGQMLNRMPVAGGVFSTANHWIVLDGGQAVEGSKVNLRMWSWGKWFNVTGMDLARLVGNFYGFVAAAPVRGA